MLLKEALTVRLLNGPNTIMNETQYDMHRVTIEEAHSKGFF